MSSKVSVDTESGQCGCASLGLEAAQRNAHSQWIEFLLIFIPYYGYSVVQLHETFSPPFPYPWQIRCVVISTAMTVYIKRSPDCRDFGSFTFGYNALVPHDHLSVSYLPIAIQIETIVRLTFTLDFSNMLGLPSLFLGSSN